MSMGSSLQNHDPCVYDTPFGRNNMRILLAEDERALSKAIIKIFEKNNYSADAVYDGEEALSS